MKDENRGSPPAFKSSDGAAIWINVDKNGNQYLTERRPGNNPVNYFRYTPRPQTTQTPDTNRRNQEYLRGILE